MPTLDSEFLFRMRVKLAPPMDVGPSPEGRRMVFMGRSGDDGVIYDVFAVR